MNDRRDRALRSRLPEDPAYWDDLAERIAARSAPTIETRGTRQAPWWSWMADFSPALAAAAVLALAGTWAFAPSASSEDTGGVLPVIGRAITPDDPMARVLLADSLPPAIAGLSWDDANDGGAR